MSREQQKRLINRLRGSLIASSVIGSLGLAGYLGMTTQTATATGTSTDTGTTTDSGTGPSTTSFTDTYGTGTDLSPGSGSSHATTSGS